MIVEFAKANVEHGMGLMEATVAAARQRLGPIIMTSMAFVLGVRSLFRGNRRNEEPTQAALPASEAQ